MYKTIGIIGGMGPAATADLMIKITEMFIFMHRVTIRM
jgi:aspartate/glutamate racemase